VTTGPILGIIVFLANFVDYPFLRGSRGAHTQTSHSCFVKKASPFEFAKTFASTQRAVLTHESTSSLEEPRPI